MRWVKQFVEKPVLAQAEQYLADGWLWNSGNFAFGVRTLLDELDRHAPEIARAARAATADLPERTGRHVLSDAFQSALKVSIDYALMEKTDRAAVAPLDTAWSDLGAWDAVHAALDRDSLDNAAPTHVLLHDTEASLVRSSTRQSVAVVGLKGVGVIVEDDAILVTDLKASQTVKQVGARFSATRSAPPSMPNAGDRLQAEARRWDRWLRSAALPLWCTVGADRNRGAFAEAIDLDVRPVAGRRRLRVQARQTYVYALAGQMGWDGPWPEAVSLGLESLQRFHRRPDGGFRTLVEPDRSPADDTVMLYDQAFVLLALAWAARAGVHRSAERDTLWVLERAIEPRRSRDGGFEETDARRPWQSNPNMHLFEATLCWAEVGTDPRWAALADEIGGLALDRFVDATTGALREFYKADWSPADNLDGRVVEPGHQFEWAWLLGRWGAGGPRPDAIGVAHRLFAIGADYGVDSARGVAIQSLNDDFSPNDFSARLWPQTERLKAALLLSQMHDGSERAQMQAEAAHAAQAMGRYVEGLPPGLWRDRLMPDGSFMEEAAPASSLYHIACGISELFNYANIGQDRRE